MKRILLIGVISLLFVSGWSHVLAAAFCPNMKEMPGCPMQKESPSTTEHAGMEMGGMEVPSSPTSEVVGALERLPLSCCANRPYAPPAPTVASKGAEQSKRNPLAILKPALKVIARLATSFAPPVISRQHAPPGASTPRHVLISLYLI